MSRRFSILDKLSSTSASASSSATPYLNESDDGKDTESKTTAVVRDDPLPPVSLKVKRVDHYYSRWSKGWKYRNMNSRITVETIPILQAAANDQWKDCCFVIVRKIPRQENIEPTFKLVVKSEYILKACKDVIKTWPGVSWNADPLEVDPELFLTFFPLFKSYAAELSAKKGRAEHESHTLSSVNTLIQTLSTDYRATLSTLDRLLSHAEITFDLLFALYTPRKLLVTRCAITGRPRLFALKSFLRSSVEGKPAYQLTCESVDMIDNATGGVRVGRVQNIILVKMFRGTVRIDTLDAYPIQYHPSEDILRKEVLARGKKWAGLTGVHHKQFNGIAGLKNSGNKVVKHNVRSRIMVDRATFRRQHPNHQFPRPATTDFEIQESQRRQNQPPMPPPMDPYYFDPNMSHRRSRLGCTRCSRSRINREDLLITSTVVFGFSLADKIWLEFDVEKIQDVDWNQDAFENLVLPPGRKHLLQSLVEAHHRGIGFDDFIKGKGHGLVVNLFGPPGVGKTFSAEATSEHVKRPLYVIGGGDLGTKAADLDAALEKVFDVATAWKAIVLIDEADVFLERRSLHDLERNAMVAVFLRHVEYYRGILFLTTNRVQAFDEAFLSRIHVAMHFHELTVESKAQVWTAFLKKIAPNAREPMDEAQIAELARRGVNGRQIKNAVRTAVSLAGGRGEKVAFRHFVETMNAMEEFTKEFEGIKVA
ncbi:P-loop containing nucleoside triphosphate hydrolase protein [Infundibulicybe gibba]|nr:P-loop containing nucleoside triphosphate hydrolase protein [Infundibulicybe gibba]